MKILALGILLTLSFNSFSHCGACGEGGAEDHKEKGEDSSHHDHDHDHKGKKKKMNESSDSEEG